MNGKMRIKQPRHKHVLLGKCAHSEPLFGHEAAMIDWQRVRQLQDEIGKDEFAEVVMLFLDEADDVLGRISPARGAAALRDDCHFLKGAALNLGFESLAALCQLAERRAKDGDCTINIAEIQSCYHASRTALLASLADLAA